MQLRVVAVGKDPGIWYIFRQTISEPHPWASPLLEGSEGMAIQARDGYKAGMIVSGNPTDTVHAKVETFH